MHRDELPIPDPCHADWEAMEPRDKARFCSACSIEVIDVSAYAEREARDLAARPRPSRVCMSYVVRADGTIRFADTPARPIAPSAPSAPDVPLRALTRRGRSMVAAATLALAACQPISDASQALLGAELPVLAERRTAGEPVAIPQPPPPPPPTAPDAGTRAMLDPPPPKPEVTSEPVAPCAPDGVPGAIGDERRIRGGVTATDRSRVN